MTDASATRAFSLNLIRTALEQAWRDLAEDHGYSEPAYILDALAALDAIEEWIVFALDAENEDCERIVRSAAEAIRARRRRRDDGSPDEEARDRFRDAAVDGASPLG